MDCVSIMFETAIPKDSSGGPMFIEPRNVKSACHNGNQDVYTLPGFPGEYASAKDIEREIDKYKAVLESPEMASISTESLPPPLKFVKQLHGPTGRC